MSKSVIINAIGGMKMILNIDEERIFNSKFRKMRLTQQPLSKYAIREIAWLKSENDRLWGDEKLESSTDCLHLEGRDLLDYEIDRIVKVSFKHPDIRPLVFQLHYLFATEAENLQLVKYEIIRLQSALRMKINPEFYNEVSEVFDKICMDVVNDHYVDRYRR